MIIKHSYPIHTLVETVTIANSSSVTKLSIATYPPTIKMASIAILSTPSNATTKRVAHQIVHNNFSTSDRRSHFRNLRIQYFIVFVHLPFTFSFEKEKILPSNFEKYYDITRYFIVENIFNENQEGICIL